MSYISRRIIGLLMVLFPAISAASLQGEWNVTEFVTVKTIWDKQTQIQQQQNQTKFTFGANNNFTRVNQDILLTSGTYKENGKKRSYQVGIKKGSYSQVDNANSIKARMQANLAALGYNVLSFKVQSRKFNGRIFNETVYLAPLSEDVNIIRGSYGYTVTMKIALAASPGNKQTMIVKVDSTYAGVKNTTDTGSLEWAIENKKRLWPML